MIEMSKEQLILECTKIVTPFLYQMLHESYDPSSGAFIRKCVSAGLTMAEEIQRMAEDLPDKSKT